MTVLLLLVVAVGLARWLEARRPLDPGERLDRLHRSVYGRERRR